MLVVAIVAGSGALTAPGVSTAALGILGPLAPLAGPAPADAAAGDSRPIYLARQLRKDPVYVSPSLARISDPAQVAALRREVAAMPYPTFVVLAPGFRDEPGLQTFADLPTVLRDRVGRDGLYLVSDENSYGIEAEAFGVRPKGDVSRIGSIAGDGVGRDEGPVARLRFALRNLATNAPATRSVDDEREAADARPWWFFGISALLGLLVPLSVASRSPGARRRRQARRAARAAAREAVGGGRPGVPEGSRGLPTRADARRIAQEAAAGLARAIAEAPAPPDQAVRSYDAASHVLTLPGATALDYLGAETLATAGRGQLSGGPWAPCLFDPRHGEGTEQTRWRRGGDETTIPACASCAALVRRGAAPPVLLDGDEPYWDRDTVWSRTGFGALDDRLADVVLAGGRSVR